MAREEIGLLASLIIAAVSILYRFDVSNFNAQLWAGMLVVQTLPYWAALIVSMLNVLPGKSRQHEPVMIPERSPAHP